MTPTHATARVRLDAYDQCGPQPVPAGTRGLVSTAWYDQRTGEQWYLVSWPMGLTVMPTAVLFTDCEVVCTERTEFTVDRGGRLRARLAAVAKREARSLAAQRGWATRRAHLT